MYKIIVLASLMVLGIASGSNADSGYIEVNHELTRSNNFRPDDKLVVMEMKVEPKDFDKNEVVPKKLKFHQTPKKQSKSNACYFGGKNPMQLGCELLPLSMGTYDYNYVYTFRMKSQQGNWYELFSSDGAKTFWISSNESAGVKFDVIALDNWILRGAGFIVNNQDPEKQAYIYEKPDTASETVGQCGSIRPGITGLIHMEQIKGDFVEVFCEAFDCYAEKSPNHQFDEIMLDSAKSQIEFMKELMAKGKIENRKFDNEEKEIREIQAAREHWKSQKACITGWTQWRSSEGHILLSPKEGLSY